ncbi:hypothetical protein E5H62_24735, partial [Salmonella enterica subsp. enterica serovar Schwarzengrund]|nr:hypothetical protein [Salmonella enterica subsp. enterica serovar Schwarzengrund]
MSESNFADFRIYLFNNVRNRSISDTKTTVVPPFWRFLKALWLKNSLNMVYFPNSKLTPLTRRYVPTS